MAAGAISPKVGSGGVAEVARAIDLCADHGVNLIDTADIYSFGHCEELIGEATGGKLKDGMLIATKARFPMGKGPNDQGLSRHHLIRACEASLRRLRIETIDLYQLHQRDGETPLEETMEALDSLVRSGKVRYVGCSNFSGWHVMKAMEIARRDGRVPFSLAADSLHAAGARGGIRTDPDLARPGPRRDGVEPARRRPVVRQAPSQRRRAAGHASARRLEASRRSRTRASCSTSSRSSSRSAEARGVSAAQIALAWLLGRPAVSTLDRRRAHRGAAQG